MSKPQPIRIDTSFIRQQAGILEDTFDAFGMRTKVTEVENHGQEIEYHLEIAEGTKLTHFKTRSSDIALAMASPTGKVKIEAPIPGTSMVGITIPIAKPSQSKRKKNYQIITVTKEVKVREYSMAEMLRDGTTSLFKIIGKYSYLLAEKANQIGRKSEEDTK